MANNDWYQTLTRSIFEQQSQQIWMSEKPNLNVPDDFLFPMTPQSSFLKSYSDGSDFDTLNPRSLSNTLNRSTSESNIKIEERNKLRSSNPALAAASSMLKTISLQEEKKYGLTLWKTKKMYNQSSTTLNTVESRYGEVHNSLSSPESSPEKNGYGHYSEGRPGKTTNKALPPPAVNRDTKPTKSSPTSNNSSIHQQVIV